MKIGILTLPLHNNYGGIIQATALSATLRALGHETVLIEMKEVRSVMQRLVGHCLRRVPGQNLKNVRAMELERQRHYPFVRARFSARSGILRGPDDLAKYTAAQKLDAIIVGSDQVWRIDYIKKENIPIYFLDLKMTDKVRKISYAASFGKGEWPLPMMRDEVARMISDFDAVSCREISGTHLLASDFKRTDAVTVLDPTLIVDASFYEEAAAPAFEQAPYVLRYVLDDSQVLQHAAQEVIAGLERKLEIRTVSLNDGALTLDIPQWLRAFKDAEFIVTDSFHGTVFAILFRKNFVSIGNRTRGLDRFTSLLEQLGLTERLLLDDDEEKARHLARTPVDFDNVCARLSCLRVSSFEFLRNSLKR